MDPNHRKLDYFSKLEVNGKSQFKCQLCQKVLSTKQRMLGHLQKIHNFSKYFIVINLHEFMFPSLSQFSCRINQCALVQRPNLAWPSRLSTPECSPTMYLLSLCTHFFIDSSERHSL